jgi:hypothetical protein
MASPLLEQRGVALPLALVGLALLAPLMLAFAALCVSEPIIAGNQVRTSQARTLAESGLEYALWALSNPTEPGGLSPAAAPAPAPFDGRTNVRPGATGGFTVSVASHAGGDPQVRTITAVGRVPGPGGEAHRRVVADVVRVPPLGARARCALCVRGSLHVAGDVAIDGTNRDPACGGDDKFGTLTGGTTTLGGAATVRGGAGATAPPAPAAELDALTLSPAALDTLRAIALRRGTYYGPGFARGGLVSDGGASWDGRIVFDAAHPLPDGVVFIDTTDGRALEPGTTPGTLATARLDAGATASPDGRFTGWIVVNGSLEIAGGLGIRGLVYAAATLTYRGPGAGTLEGLAIAQGAHPASAHVEPAPGGRLGITFDCGHASGRGLVPRGFVVVPGTYREEHD